MLILLTALIAGVCLIVLGKIFFHKQNGRR